MMEISHVSKTYPTGKKANRDISFRVESGEIVALVGPNGSGKTTLMQQMTGVLKKQEGTISIGQNEGSLRSITYVPQFPAYEQCLTVRESLLMVAKYIGLPKKEQARRVSEALERTGLAAFQNQLTYTLSGGQLKLLAFASILVDDAPNVILDEVSSMVDVVTRQKIWSIIQEEKLKGRAILLSSHDLEEVKRLCDKLVVLKDGQVIFFDSPDRIRNPFCKSILTVEDSESLAKYLNEINQNFVQEGNRFSLVTPDLESMREVVGDFSKRFTLTSYSCDYPAFYDGIMKMMSSEEEK